MSTHYIYRCYDVDGDLIYTGCTSNVKQRIAAHRKSRVAASRWLTLFMARYEVDGPYPDRDAAREAERHAIQLEQPLFNYQHRGDVTQAPWMTRDSVAVYLLERGHIELAVETTCRCWREVREAGYFDPQMCLAHQAAHDAGLSQLPELPADFYADSA